MLPIDDGAPRARDQRPSRRPAVQQHVEAKQVHLRRSLSDPTMAVMAQQDVIKQAEFVYYIIIIVTPVSAQPGVHPALQEPDPLCNATSGCFFLSSAQNFREFKKRYYRIDGLQENEEENDEPTGRETHDHMDDERTGQETPLYPTRFGAVCSDGSIRVSDLQGESYDKVLWWDRRLQNVYDADVSRDRTLLLVMNIYREAGGEGRFREELCVYHLTTGEQLWRLHVDYEFMQLVNPFANKDDRAYGEYLVASDDAGSVSGDDGGRTTLQMRGKMVTSGADRKVVNTDSVPTTRRVRLQVNKDFDKMLTTNHEEDSCLILWDLNTGKEKRRYNRIHTKGICCARFTSDGESCLTGSVDKTAAITNLSTGETTQRFVGHQDVVHLAALSPDEDTLATGSYDKTVRIWDVATGVVLHMIADPYSAPSCILFQHPAWLLTCSTHGDAMGINIKDGMKVPWYVGLRWLFYFDEELVRMRPLMLPAAFDGSPSSSPIVLTFSSRGSVTSLDLSARQLPLEQVVLKRSASMLRAVYKVRGFTSILPNAAEGKNGAGLLKVLLEKGEGVINSAPLPANRYGLTPLDMAVANGYWDAVELLLANEVSRAAPLRLAVMKAWNELAWKRPAMLVKFLDAVGIERLVVTQVARGGPDKNLLVFGSQMDPTDPTDNCKAEKVADELANEHRDGGGVLANIRVASTSRFRSYAKGLVDWLLKVVKDNLFLSRVWPLEHRWYEFGFCGLPHVARMTRYVYLSPLGALVANHVHGAFSTDAIAAVITYKWDMYAGKIYRRQAVGYCFFMALYITTTTIGLEWYPSVGRLADMYGRRGVSTGMVVRFFLELLLLLGSIRYLWRDLLQVSRQGVHQYFFGMCMCMYVCADRLKRVLEIVL
ncbi:hypothetical protein VOLCADRAFT_108400 [Volvox carteri f. nagariensis]|uniref:Ion transport domain-containing protein n=1 Tax=Volvox carteri f. nagariensis TaxID=3068 RepID=D8UJY9_VOLCA|nr:uncharacterized protein VOLCADRAFT_108400 [Volvox carteri f. nagariensis]EFJ39957.1 hypothetical protein VOLCADRAFT_108400 [Volvox carteri f. nagariensis]|eukprot:XP_002958982.1 hypothetical protein VOLCADRAFT_108400 [Volvox carteri f. nagariensis]